jgi:hypothetical protein
LYLYKKKHAEYAKEYGLKIAKQKAEQAYNIPIKKKPSDINNNSKLENEFIESILAGGNLPNNSSKNIPKQKNPNEQKPSGIPKASHKQEIPVATPVQNPPSKKKLKIVSYEDEIAKLISEAYDKN